MRKMSGDEYVAVRVHTHSGGAAPGKHSSLEDDLGGIRFYIGSNGVRKVIPLILESAAILKVEENSMAALFWSS